MFELNRIIKIYSWIILWTFKVEAIWVWAVTIQAKITHYNYLMQEVCMLEVVLRDQEIKWHRRLSEMRLTCNTYKYAIVMLWAKQVVKMLGPKKAVLLWTTTNCLHHIKCQGLLTTKITWVGRILELSIPTVEVE